MSLPQKIVLWGDQEFPVVLKPLNGKLGYLDQRSGIIAIDRDQSSVGKHITLLHELLHFVAELMVQNGVLQRRPPESFIENAAPILLSLFVRSGLWRGLKLQELDDFFGQAITQAGEGARK